MSDDDALMRGFFRLKALLIEAQETFGEDAGARLVALAGVMVEKAAEEGAKLTREECYRYIVDELTVHPTSFTITEPVEPNASDA